MDNSTGNQNQKNKTFLIGKELKKKTYNIPQRIGNKTQARNPRSR